mmetsp:Transcript_20596/g.61420  ORF Transcript_20596/g.61420 Transcript_20596/m.61420 type:complete len:337 (+) Transcript_20596:386-1396(+)|eukprot:363754-Chlamydomonas_euryale.AAC.9
MRLLCDLVIAVRAVERSSEAAPGPGDLQRAAAEQGLGGEAGGPNLRDGADVQHGRPHHAHLNKPVEMKPLGCSAAGAVAPEANKVGGVCGGADGSVLQRASHTRHADCAMLSPRGPRHTRHAGFAMLTTRAVPPVASPTPAPLRRRRHCAARPRRRTDHAAATAQRPQTRSCPGGSAAAGCPVPARRNRRRRRKRRLVGARLRPRRPPAAPSAQAMTPKTCLDGAATASAPTQATRFRPRRRPHLRRSRRAELLGFRRRRLRCCHQGLHTPHTAARATIRAVTPPGPPLCSALRCSVRYDLRYGPSYRMPTRRWHRPRQHPRQTQEAAPPPVATRE